MSDFHSKLNSLQRELIRELVSLDLCLNEELRMLSSSGAWFDWVRACSIDRIYFKGEKPILRQDVHGPLDAYRPFLARLFGKGRTEACRSKDNVAEIAARLRLTQRHVTRKLGQLLKAGEIPADWRKGGQWRPPLEEAAFRLGKEPSRAGFTRRSCDRYLDYLVGCRNKREQLEDRLEDFKDIERTCQRWYELTLSHPFHSQDWDPRLERKSFDLMQCLAEKKGWDFCRLFVALAGALLQKSRTPVEDARVSLNQGHATFYRRFGKMVNEARLLSDRWVGDNSVIDRAASLTNKTEPEDASSDLQYVFDHWKNEVPEGQLFVR